MAKFGEVTELGPKELSQHFEFINLFPFAYKWFNLRTAQKIGGVIEEQLVGERAMFVGRIFADVYEFEPFDYLSWNRVNRLKFSQVSIIPSPASNEKWFSDVLNQEMYRQFIRREVR